MKFSVSFYHGLTTAKFILGGKSYPFDWIGYLNNLKAHGIPCTRAFATLPWSGPGYDAKRFVLPYKATAQGFDFDSANRVNPAFADRIDQGGKVGTEIMLCLIDGGWGFPWYPRMGYHSQKEYFGLADGYHPAWERLQRQHSDIAKMTAAHPAHYAEIEYYNEGQYGSIVDEYKAFRKAWVAAGRSGVRLQSDPAFNLLTMQAANWSMGGEQFESEAGFAKWLDAQMSGKLGFKVHRWTFHGIFTPDGIKRHVALWKKWGFPLATIGFATDGATPAIKNGKFIFTESSHGGHYNYRKDLWANNFNGVVDGHKQLKAEAEHQGVSYFDIQDPATKWSETLDYKGAKAQEWYGKLA